MPNYTLNISQVTLRVVNIMDLGHYLELTCTPEVLIIPPVGSYFIAGEAPDTVAGYVKSHIYRFGPSGWTIEIGIEVRARSRT